MVKDRFSTRRFAAILENKLHVFAARFTEASILLAPLAFSFKKYSYLVSKPPTVHVKANVVVWICLDSYLNLFDLSQPH